MIGKLLLVDAPSQPFEPFLPSLYQWGVNCTTIEGNTQALQKIEIGQFDILLLNMGFPNSEGLLLCRYIRTLSHLPLLMLHPNPTLQDVLSGLEAGADDYIQEPYHPQEIAARVRAHVRRRREYNASQSLPKQQLQIGTIRLDLDSHQVYVQDRLVRMTAAEFRLLSVLMENQDVSLSRRSLIEKAGEKGHVLEANSLPVLIQRLRRKLECAPDSPTYVQTIHGHGYRFSKGRKTSAD